MMHLLHKLHEGELSVVFKSLFSSVTSPQNFLHILEWTFCFRETIYFDEPVSGWITVVSLGTYGSLLLHT